MRPDEQKGAASSSRHGRSQPPTVSVRATAMHNEAEDRFQEKIIELLTSAVRERLIEKEEAK
jgi:hypothetical protein